MDQQFRNKSDLYVFAGYVLLLIAVGINFLTIPWLQGQGWFPVANSFNLHANDLNFYLPTALDLIFLVTGGLMVWGKKNLKFLINNSLAYNLFLLVVSFAILFSINGISPGRFKFLRIVLVLGMIFSPHELPLPGRDQKAGGAGPQFLQEHGRDGVFAGIDFPHP